MSLMLIFVLLWNAGIGWLNAYLCGKVWAESKAVGGWVRLITWCGAIQSAIGISSVVLAGVGGLVSLSGYPEIIRPLFGMWYLAVILPALGTGLLITIESWRHFWRSRDLMNLSTSGINTLVQVHNTLGAINGIGEAFSGIGEFFSEVDDFPVAIFLLLLAMVVLSIASGSLITYLLIRKYAATDPLPEDVQEAFLGDRNRYGYPTGAR